MDARGEPKAVWFQFQKVNADGTVDPNVVITGYWHRSRFRRLLWRLTHRGERYRLGRLTETE